MKIEEYLNSIEKKELIYLFLSIPIVVFIIYYNFVYPKLVETHKILSAKISKQQKTLSKLSIDIRNIQHSKQKLIPIKKRLETLKADYKYIKYNFDTLEFIKLDDKKIYKVFTDLLNKANKLNLNASFIVKWNEKTLPPFNQFIEIEIEGVARYESIVQYIQFIDYLNTLKIIHNVTISINKSQSNVINALITQKKINSSKISFVLIKYSNKDIQYLKELANNNNLNLTISIDPKNSNYLDITFKGKYEKIKQVLQSIKGLQNSKNVELADIKVELNRVKNKINTKLQKFNITLDIVGVQ